MAKRRPTPPEPLIPPSPTEIPNLDEIGSVPLDLPEVHRLGVGFASHAAVERHPAVIAGREAVRRGASLTAFTRGRLLLWNRSEDAWRAAHPHEDGWPKRGALRLPETRRNPA